MTDKDAGDQVGTTVKASPTKAFFVRMLTRDITLDDCILDLIDNSIDGAWRAADDDPSELKIGTSLSPFQVAITFSTDSFSIADNCGGITFSNAAKYAFTFGRAEDEPHSDEYSVGVYGIGMKRAVFKLGNDITIDSTFEENGKLDAFRVPINVPRWLAVNSGPWDFDVDQADPAPEPGVTITVRDLSSETRSRFGDPTYEKALRRVLARDYMVPLMRGLQISVNGIDVIGWQLSLSQSDDFSPMRSIYVDDGVKVEIIAGMASPPPDDIGPDNSANATDPSGWYVLCNGRAVVAADTTSVTGWGQLVPKWHNQYAGFVGAVLFSSDDPIRLPMTTTKRSVDVSSDVYRRALVKMAVPARSWIDYTNARKPDPTAVKELEGLVTGVELSTVAPRPAFVLPTVQKSPARARVANINFAVPLKRVQDLGSSFGDLNMNYRDVGIRAFDYAYEQLVDEE